MLRWIAFSERDVSPGAEGALICVASEKPIHQAWRATITTELQPALSQSRHGLPHHPIPEMTLAHA